MQPSCGHYAIVIGILNIPMVLHMFLWHQVFIAIVTNQCNINYIHLSLNPTSASHPCIALPAFSKWLGVSSFGVSFGGCIGIVYFEDSSLFISTRKLLLCLWLPVPRAVFCSNAISVVIVSWWLTNTNSVYTATIQNFPKWNHPRTHMRTSLLPLTETFHNAVIFSQPWPVLTYTPFRQQ